MNPRIALEGRLRHCKNVTTLGVRTNLSDYDEGALALIRKAPIIYYPTSFYADIFDTMGKKTFPSYHSYKYAQDKIKQTALFRLTDVPHPRTHFFYGDCQKATIQSHFRFPFVGKIPRGSALGKGVYLIRNETDLAKYIRLTRVAYIQEYMPIDRDLRVIVIADRVVHAYWRIAAEGEFRANVFQGAKISFDHIPEPALDLALETAAKCRLNDVGIDICFSGGSYWVLEANMKYGKEGFRQAGIDFYALMDRLIENGTI